MAVKSTPDRNHVSATRVLMFDAIERIDWEDIERAADLTQRVLREFAADRALFRCLLDKVPDDPYLWSKCEQDVVEDKIVLWDDVAKGLRIRLRISTASQERLAHNHRFSFSNLVLRGKYLHWHYVAEKGFNEQPNLEDVRTVCMHEDRAGDSFTIHHSALHSTPFTEVGTVSLVLRGNPVKRRAPVMFKESRGRAQALRELARSNAVGEVEPAVAHEGTMFYRIGEEDESPERRAERQMTRERYEHWRRQLAEWEII